MAILNVFGSVDYAFGRYPCLVNIQTSDSLATIMATGYLDSEMTLTYSSNMIALVQANEGLIYLQVDVAGGHTSLINPQYARVQSSASRSLNSGFQISTLRDCMVHYSVDIAATMSLIAGQTGTIFLEIASNSGFSTNLQELGRFVNGNSGTLTIGLNLTQTVSGNLSGFVPAGYYCRIRTDNTSGTPTFTYRSGQEVLL